MVDEFISQLENLNGQYCQGYIGGNPAGSIISIDFSKKKKSVGKNSLFIWCAWRIEDKEKIICSWTDSNEVNGPMLRGLEKLKNKNVESVRVEKPAYDLTLRFEDGFYLKLFCDQTNPEENTINYTFFTTEFAYSVEGKGIVTKELG